MSENQADNRNIARFLLILFLGFIGSFIINHSSLRPKGWKSRTCSLFFWGLFTGLIYWIVVLIGNLTFTSNAVGYQRQVGYFRIAE